MSKTYPNQQPFLKRGPTFQFCQFCLQFFVWPLTKTEELDWRYTKGHSEWYFFLEGRKMDIHRVWLIYHAPWKKNGTALEIFQKHQSQDWCKRWKDWGPPAVSLGPAPGTPVDPSRFCNAADSAMRQRTRSEVHQFHHELRGDAPSSLEQELTCCYHPWGSHPEEA